MMERGFSLVELLVTMAVSALVVGALAAALVPARAAFDTTPAALDLQQRSRIAVAVLAGGVRSGGAAQPFVPVLIPIVGSGVGNAFADVELVRQITPGASGMLDRDQPAAGAALTLLPAGLCPRTPDVCGFTVGTTAAIADGQGRFDIFEVAATDALRMTVLPRSALSAPYGAGARLFEAEAFRYSLVQQPDGSKSLIRAAITGGSQPVVDGVTGLSISLWGEEAPPQIAWDGANGQASYGPAPPAATFHDAGGAWPVGESCFTGRDASGPWSRLNALSTTGTLVQLTRTDLSDGPWCAAGTMGLYDADLLRLRRVDIELRLETLVSRLRGPSGRLFSRPGSAAQSATRWVPDRVISTSVSLRGPR